MYSFKYTYIYTYTMWHNATGKETEDEDKSHFCQCVLQLPPFVIFFVRLGEKTRGSLTHTTQQVCVYERTYDIYS